MLTLLLILAVAALVLTLIAITGRVPLYVPVLVLACIECLRHIPLGR